jgi:hypothetical protein
MAAAIDIQSAINTSRNSVEPLLKMRQKRLWTAQQAVKVSIR